ncbi:MAG: pirin family protein [Acidobacteria bacterium]|nr:pirin family protein [Acidobacteriota bacterium]MBV9476658.1 pirin family protein [Acidobacteriota bacterium]
MITVRRADERGHFDHGWLNTYHTFSFADYHDPRFMGFRSLRVINEDRVKAGVGFGTHGHRDMEILSYVLEGTLAHRDSMGNGSAIRPGDVQRMSAGTGVLHSEMNPSEDEGVHFLQIWILPERRGLTPGYEEKHFDENARHNTLRLVASPDGRDGSVTIHQNVSVYSTLLDGDASVTHAFAPNRAGWLQVARGEVDVNGTTLRAGDGAAIEDEASVTIVGRGAEALLFDLD